MAFSKGSGLNTAIAPTRDENIRRPRRNAVENVPPSQKRAKRSKRISLDTKSKDVGTEVNPLNSVLNFPDEWRSFWGRKGMNSAERQSFERSRGHCDFLQGLSENRFYLLIWSMLEFLMSLTSLSCRTRKMIEGDCCISILAADLASNCIQHVRGPTRHYRVKKNRRECILILKM